MSGVLTEQGYIDSCLDLCLEARELLGIPSGSLAPSEAQWPPVLPVPPSALEFSRLVGRSAPVLIEGCIDDRPNLAKWKSTAWLIKRLADARVNVALTPNGRADDVLRLEEEDRQVFALPLEVIM